MARIRCHYVDCFFIDDGYCGATRIELDPDAGCLTYRPEEEVTEVDEDEEMVDDWELEELGGMDGLLDDDLWEDEV